MPSLFPLVGRQRELSELLQHAREAAAGRGRLVLLGGEAGGGKTALLETALREAGEMPFVLGRCPGAGETPPFGPWLEAVRRVERELGRDPEPLPPPFGRAPGDWSPREVAGALAGWLGNGGRPLLVALEDIHWADPATLDLLRHLPDQAADSPLLVLATYRSDELNRHHPLWTLLPDLQRIGAQRLLLERLTAADVAELVAAALPGTPEATALARRLHQRTDGHPLFLRELLANAARSGGAPDEALPETVQQAIDRKLAGLRPGAREVLAAAAIIGEQFAYDLLAQVVDVSEEELLSLLEEAVALRVLQPRGAAGDIFQFDHALFREALVRQLIGPRRRRWHARAAAVLAASPSPDVEALALHLSRAGDARAGGYLKAAADQALQMGALAQAADLYEQSLGFLAEAGPQRGESLLKLGFCLKYIDLERGLACFRDALQAAEAGTDRPVAVWSRHMLAAFGGGDDNEMAGVQAAEDELLPDPRYQQLETELFGAVGGYPRIGTRLAIWYAMSGRAEQGAAVLQSLEERARAGATHELLDAAMFVNYAAGRQEVGLDLSLRAVEAALAARDYRSAVRHLLNYVNTALLSGRPQAEVDAAARRLAALETEAWERSGYPYHPGGYSVLGFYQLARGDWAAAERNLVECQRRLRSNIAPDRFFAESLLLETGRLSELHSLLATHPPHRPNDPPPFNSVEAGYHALHAQLCLATGDQEGARTWLAGADHWQERLSHMASRPMVEFTWAAWHRGVGDAASARGAAGKALEAAERRQSVIWICQAHRVLGELAAAADRHEAAARHLETARDLAERGGLPYYLALVQLSTARALPGGPGALEGLRQARMTFARLGAAPALAEAAGLLEKYRERRGTAPAVASAPLEKGAPMPDGLTEREAQVVRLVARGLTDKEIAAQLFISPRTVDGHLRNIFNKVGVGNRVALAAYAAQMGLMR